MRYLIEKIKNLIGSNENRFVLTKKIRNRLPLLHSQDNIKDPVAQVKFFISWGSMTCYVVEFDGEDTFFGKMFCFSFPYGKICQFSLSNLQELKGSNGKIVERDKRFKPTVLSKCTRR